MFDETQKVIFEPEDQEKMLKSEDIRETGLIYAAEAVKSKDKESFKNWLTSIETAKKIAEDINYNKLNYNKKHRIAIEEQIALADLYIYDMKEYWMDKVEIPNVPEEKKAFLYRKHGELLLHVAETEKKLSEIYLERAENEDEEHYWYTMKRSFLLTIQGHRLFHKANVMMKKGFGEADMFDSTGRIGDELTIRKIIVNDYKIFDGYNVIIPDKKLTLFVGENGTGKTILFNALRQAILDKQEGIFVEIEDKEKIKKYSDIIFIRGEDCCFLDELSENFKKIAMEHREKINKTLTLFLLSVEKQKTSLQDFKLEVNTSGTLEIIHIQKGLIPTECLATGEKHLFYFMYLFALRNVIDKNFPLIIDDPFGRLDRELKNAMYRLIEQINSQVMILGFHDDCQKLKPNKKYGLLFHDQKRKTKIIRLTL